MKKLNSKSSFRFVGLFVSGLFGLLLVLGLTIRPSWANLSGAMNTSQINQSHHSLDYVQNYVKMGNSLYAQATSDPTVEAEPIVPECTEGVYYLPNPYDCKTFYQCANGIPVLMPCAEGTEWDDILQTCNWPDQAQCVDLPLPSN